MANLVTPIKPSFSGGEFAPSLYSRVDIQKYGTGARRLRNFFVHPHGGISNRPGLHFVANTKTSGTTSRLLDFQFASDENYVVEFGANYNRFFRDDAQVFSSGTTPYELASVFAEDDLASIRYAQSADVMFIVHPDFQPRELQRLGNATWQYELYQFTGGPFRLANSDTTLTMKVSNLTGDATLTASAAFFYATHASSTYNTGALMQLNHYIEGNAISQSFVGTGTSSYVACGGTWRIISHGTWTGIFKVEKSDDGTAWTTLRQFSSKDDFNVDTYGAEDMSDGALPFYVRVNMQSHTSGSCNVDITTDTFEQQGIVKIREYVSETVVLVDVQRTIGSTATTSNWAEGAWSDYRGWPSAVAFSQDRLVFAGSLYNPQTMWMTQTGNYYSFFRNSPLVDSDGVTLNLPSQKLNQVNGMVSLLQLLVFTSGSEWSIGGGSQSDVVSPTSTNTKLNGYTGSNGIQPVVIVNRAIYVQSRGSVVRDLGYDLFSETFTGSNLSILSNHLFTNYNIVEMAYQQDPDSLVWAVRDDGKLLCMTYMREQEVLAWTWCDTYGGDDLFESITTIPASGYNQVWVVVNRGGQRTIERMDQRLNSSLRSRQFFVDSGAIYDSTTTPDTNTKLLMHMDGIEASTTFTDEQSHVVTNNYDTFTKLLLHFDDTAETIVVTDSEYAPKAITNTESYDSYTKLMLHGDDVDGGQYNHLYNGSFEIWSDGTSSAPDEWTLAGAGSVAREGTIIRIGYYSVKLTAPGGTEEWMRQYFHESKGIDYWRGKTVTFGCWVYNTTGQSVGQLRIYDSEGSTTVAAASVYDEWQWVTVTHTIDASATSAQVAIVAPSPSYYNIYDGAMLFETITDSIGNTVSLPNETNAVDSYTKLLIHFNGIDSWSAYTAETGQPLAFVGTSTIDTAQYKFGWSSLLLDGNSDYVTLGNNVTWQFGTGDFTVDCWCRWNDLTGEQAIVGHYNDANNNWSVYKTADNKLGIYFVIGGVIKGYYVTTSAVSFSADTWYHIAFERTTTSAKIFVDGVSKTLTETNAFSTNDVGAVSGLLYIGQDGANDVYFNGWIDEVRISKGIARWSADFTPPSYPYGHVSVTTSQKELGTGSLYFPDGGAYLQLADSDDWNFGTGDFTIDMWVRWNSTTGAQCLICQYEDASNVWTLWKQTDHKLKFYAADDGVTKAVYTMTNAPTFTIGVWYHITLCRSTTNIYMFINGVSQTLTANTAVGTNDLGDLTGTLNIGLSVAGTADYFNGWIDEVRISKGIARWTSNFTPRSYNYGFVWNSNIESKFGNLSANFDGSGSYLSVADSDDWSFGTGNFTVDFWVRFNDLTGTQVFCSQYEDDENLWGIYKETTTHKLHMVFVSGASSQGDYVMSSAWAAAVDTWYHLVFERTTTSAKIFINGISQTLTETTAFSTNDVGNVTSALFTGQNGNEEYFLNGYMDELRISKGIARWTSSFTVPSKAYNIYVATDTATKKFGTASASFRNGNYLTVADSDDWNFGSSNFTIDAWVRFASVNDFHKAFIGQYEDADNFVNCYFYNDGTTNKIDMTVYDGGVCKGGFSANFSPLINTWYHVAIVRDGSTPYIFVNGISQAVTTAVALDIFPDITGDLAVGILNGNTYMHGWIDELRIRKGIATWTSDFTPFSEAYTIYGEPTNVVPNLTHLEDRTVACLADGNVQNQQIVSGGTITLEDSYSYIVTGLPYFSDLETLNVEVSMPDGSLQGRRVHISRVILRILNSRGGWLGPDEDNLHELLGDYKTSVDTSLYEGDVKITLGQGYKDGGRFFFRQIDPLPITILGVIPIMTPGGVSQI